MINIENLTKRFDERIAVAGIDLEIKRRRNIWPFRAEWSRKDYYSKDNDVTFEKKFRICKDMWI